MNYGRICGWSMSTCRSNYDAGQPRRLTDGRFAATSENAARPGRASAGKPTPRAGAAASPDGHGACRRVVPDGRPAGRGRRPISKRLPGGSEFFPIGVWLQWPGRAPLYQAMGINTIVGLYEGPTEAQLAELAKHGMYPIAEQNDIARRSGNSAVVQGWTDGDEPANRPPLAAG